MIAIVSEAPLPPPPPARLEKLQSSFENRFPKSYVDFLTKANGGKLAKSDVTIGNSSFVIERFLPVVDDPKTNPQGWADVAVVASQLDLRLVEDENSTGLDLIPIAALFAGDFLVLDYRGNRTEPSVAIWDHEQSDELAPFTIPIAESFSDLLRLLQIQP
jgi:hypothetical protein